MTPLGQTDARNPSRPRGHGASLTLAERPVLPLVMIIRGKPTQTEALDRHVAAKDLTGPR